MRKLTPAYLCLGVLLALFDPAGAQQHPNVQRGFAADKIYQFDIDQVNLLNGNVMLNISLASYPLAESLIYNINLFYNSKVWDFESVSISNEIYIQALPDRRSNAGIGWSLSVGGALVEPTDPTNESSRWLYLSPDGSEHVFYPTLHDGETEIPGISYSRDGSFLRMRAVPGIRYVEFPDGSVHSFDDDGRVVLISNRYNNYLQIYYGDSFWRLTDQYQRTSYVYFTTKFSDGQPIEVVDRVDLASFSGGRAVTQFEYSYANVERGCTDSYHAVGSTTLVPLLQQITLPDGSAYEATYYHDNDDYSCRQGSLASLRLPTLGKIEYTYRKYMMPTEGCRHREWARLTPGVSTRRFVDAAGNEVGVWSYVPSHAPPLEPSGTCLDGTSESAPEWRQTEVISPAGDRSVYFFSAWPNFATSPHGFTYREYGLPFTRLEADATGSRFLSAIHQDCDAAGENCVPQRSYYVTYEYDGPLCNFSTLCADSNRRLKSERTLYHDDGDRYADLDREDFDGLGHYRLLQTGGNFPAGNVRTVFTNYNPGYAFKLDPRTHEPVAAPRSWPSTSAWVLDTYTEQVVTEGGVSAKTQYCFEPSTGFLLRQRTMVGTSPGAHDVIRSLTRDELGNLIREEYFGGDVQSVSTSADLCALSLPANQYRIDHTYQYGSLASTQYYDQAGVAMSFKSADFTIDRNTGLVSESRDPAGLSTRYEYDTKGRLEWAKPEVGHDSWTQYVYTPATSATALAKVQILHRPNGSETATALARSEIHFESFGRVWRERRLMPEIGWSTGETRYNAMGWKSQVSEYEPTDSPVHRTQYLDYDPFGRPRTIRPPDGAAHDVRLSYTGVRLVARTTKVGTSRTAETESTTTEEYDRQQRLLRVTEPSGSGGANVTTTYGYDVGNRLAQVTTTAAAVTQVRKFTRDNRGFLLSEQHPEKGPSGNGAINYHDYDARGHAHRRTDTPHDLTYVFDRAERLGIIRETWGEKRLLKTFTYADANGPGDWRNGKLWKASRYHYVTTDSQGLIFADGFETGDLSAWSGTEAKFFGQRGSAYTVRIKQTYVYGGKGGRVSQRDLAVLINDADAESFTQSWEYNDLGDVTSVGYPRCTFPECSVAAASPRTVSFGYTRGYLTSVAGYASLLSYHPSGLVSEIAHTNGITVTQAADPHGMMRPASITATFGTTTHWTTGSYAYDGSGNVTEMGTSWFLYDPVSRLSSATLYTGVTGGGTEKQQSYAHDAFGNIQSISGTSGRATPTDSKTNRLTGGVYDSAGNLTYWNGNVYEYDAFNQLSRIIAGGEEWIYLYTADDERVWHFKIGASPRFDRWTLRDLSGKVLREYTATGYVWSAAEDYIYRGVLLLAAETSAGRRHFHLDHLGTPRLITDGGGQQVAYHVYYPFGEEASEFDQDTEKMKFTGHERDLGNPSGTGDDLDYMHARFCSPITGRFTTTDPGNYAQTTRPQSWNRYAYVLDNPLKLIDPDGRISIVFIVSPDYDTPETKYGHAAMLVTAGDARASVSLGGTQLTPTVIGFINSYLSEGRTVRAYVLVPDEERDARMIGPVEDQKKRGYKIRRHNCTSACGNVLRAGGVLEENQRPESGIITDRPQLLERALDDGVLEDAIEKIIIFDPSKVQEVTPAQVEQYLGVPNEPPRR